MTFKPEKEDSEKLVNSCKKINMNNKFLKSSIIFYILGVFSLMSFSQNIPNIDYKNPKEFEIGGIKVSGVQFIDHSIILMIANLNVGDKITVPGEEISNAVQNLWKQDLFGDVQINISNVTGKFIFLDIILEEKPRLSKFSLNGIRKSESTDLREKLKIQQNDVVTENLLKTSLRIINNHFISKGFLNSKVTYKKTVDTTKTNSVILDFYVAKGEKVRIKEIIVEGNNFFSDNKIKRNLKNTKEIAFWRVWKPSRFIKSDFQEDIKNLISKYNNFGFRDVRIAKDTLIKVSPNHLNLKINIEEGNQFFIRNIDWHGNTKYSDVELSQRLRVNKGDIFNQKIINSNLFASIDETDIHSLYMNDGYLFFSARPVETIIGEDSIDLDIMIYEGPQAHINRVSISGNTRTNDHVILREIRTKPGELFNKSNLMRTQRELHQLKYFNQEKLNVNFDPDPVAGTVDLEYIVEEVSTDQFELSGGWGLGRLVGTVGLSFNNFSLKDMLKRSAWSPIPSGNGQTLSIRAQSNGIYFQSYNLSFVEPWLGGKKPNALSLGVYHSVMSNGVTSRRDGTVDEQGNKFNRSAMKVTGLSLGLGMRLAWPDDFFVLFQNISYQYYDVLRFTDFIFPTGYSNNINYSVTLSRNSIDAPIFPRTGSNISLTAQLTPPYSLFSARDFSQATQQEKVKFLEFHKWKFNSSFFTRLAGNLVLNTRVRFGFLGYYNEDIGLSPFERFWLGGDGLSGFSLDGRELIGMRGYSNNSLTATNAFGTKIGGTIFNKYTMELRYLISPNPSATIFVLGFAEAGNTWLGVETFNPFNIYRSAGVGVRLSMPFFGLIGLDWGYGFDDVPGSPNAGRSQFHFSINNSID